MVFYKVAFSYHQDKIGYDFIKVFSDSEQEDYNESFFEQLLQHIVDGHFIYLYIYDFEDEIWPRLYKFLSKTVVIDKLKAIYWPLNLQCLQKHQKLLQVIHLSHLNQTIRFIFETPSILESDYSYDSDIILQSIRSNDLKSDEITFFVYPKPQSFYYFYYFIQSMIFNNTIKIMGILNYGCYPWKYGINLIRLNYLLELLLTRNQSIEYVDYKIKQKYYCAAMVQDRIEIIHNSFRPLFVRNQRNRSAKNQTFISLVSKHLTF